MLPLRDRNPSGIIPWVVYGLIGMNVLAFLFEVRLPQEELKTLVGTYGLVPRRVTGALRGEGNLVAALILPAFASMFLHGGWLHLLGNMWFLHIFGDNVEARVGHALFLLFYLVCGLAAGGMQYALSPHSAVPTVGASGAIAGVLGAYIVCWPRARVVTLVPLFVFITLIELPAVLVLGMWFFVQLFQGVATIGATYARGGVAYFAHIGGFVAGVVLIKLMPRQRRALPPARFGASGRGRFRR